MSTPESARVIKLVTDALTFMRQHGLVKSDADALLAAGVLGEIATESFALGAKQGKDVALAAIRNHPAGRH